jgi:hypothetical protein
VDSVVWSWTHGESKACGGTLEATHVELGAEQSCFSIRTEVSLCDASWSATGSPIMFVALTFIPSKTFEQYWKHDEDGSSVNGAYGLISGFDHPVEKSYVATAI